MAKKDKKKDKGKAKGKKKELAKKEKMLSKQSEPASKKSKKSDKKATSMKALKQEIRQLREALQAHEQSPPQPVAAALDSLTGGVDELVRSAETGSVGERKKSWERHQYLRTRYEHHLEAGSAKAQARAAADRDLRERYGDRFGYTHEELDSILS